MDNVERVALETLQLGKQAIVFVASRASAEKTAENISKLHTAAELELEQDILSAVASPTKQCRRLSHCIKKGVAFHHAGLTNKQKEIIEDGFRSGKVGIICATPTLAAGLSLPAFRVLMKSLKRYSGSWGMNWIPVLEYLQMAGRAGRPEYESVGEAISFARNSTEKDEIHERYILGEAEDISSKLAVEPVLRTYLLSLISSGIIRDEKTMNGFFAKTFWAHQYGDMQELQGKMQRMLALLEEWGFVSVTGGSSGMFVAASEMNSVKTIRPTMIGKRISELYLDPLTARHLLDCMTKYRSEIFPILQMISSTLEMRPLLRVKSKEQDMVQEALGTWYNSLLMDEPNVYDIEYPEFMNSIKTALFFDAWINEHNEDYLFETFGIRPGEIRMKIESADWLLYAASELSRLQDQ
ncbi:TPA: hypothetical protein HA278_04510, partial [Candidatus Woesearchaeota archaeon]|nr:hypothetical protein [Candidatus Woesearchaeota archaeon]